MREFVNDYIELCKDSGRFYKKHWKGVILMNVVVIGAELLWYNKDLIKDAIEDKFSKKGEEGLD